MIDQWIQALMDECDARKINYYFTPCGNLQIPNLKAEVCSGGKVAAFWLCPDEDQTEPRPLIAFSQDTPRSLSQMIIANRLAELRCNMMHK
jgi:hypothetical protein